MAEARGDRGLGIVSLPSIISAAETMLSRAHTFKKACTRPLVPVVSEALTAWNEGAWTFMDSASAEPSQAAEQAC